MFCCGHWSYLSPSYVCKAACLMKTLQVFVFSKTATDTQQNPFEHRFEKVPFLKRGGAVLVLPPLPETIVLKCFGHLSKSSSLLVFFWKGVFAEIFLINVCLGFSVQGVVSSGVMLLGCKPIAKFLAGRSPSTDPPVREIKNHFHLQCQGGVCVCVDCCAHPAEHSCASFRRKHFCTFRRISAKFPQTSLAQ